MDTRNGQIYDSYDDAKAAGVPDEFLVTGTRKALDNLKPRIRFSKGSFKVAKPQATDAGTAPR
jgi:hypothetical protein